MKIHKSAWSRHLQWKKIQVKSVAIVQFPTTGGLHKILLLLTSSGIKARAKILIFTGSFVWLAGLAG